MAGGTSVAARLARFAGLAGDRLFPGRLFLLLDRHLRGRFCHWPADRWSSPRGRLAPSRAPAGLARSATGAIPPRQLLALAHQAKVDPAAVQIHAADLHPHPRANRIADAGALAAPFLARLVELEVLAPQFGDVHQALHIHRVERHEDAEAGDRAVHAAVFLAQMLAHVLALEPSLDIAAGLVGPAFVGAAMQARSLPGQASATERLLARLAARRGQPLGQFSHHLSPTPPP